jgi:hypothetical protein
MKPLTMLATAITAVGFLTVPTPARAGPMLPLAPACSQYAFNGDFGIALSTNWTTVIASLHGQAAGGRAVTVNQNNRNSKNLGYASGGIQGRNVDIRIKYDDPIVPPDHFMGTVGDDARVHGGTLEGAAAGVNWDSSGSLNCLDAPPAGPVVGQTLPPPKTAIPGAPAGARLTIAATGPTTLPVGLSGTYTVTVANNGDVSAPGDLYISYGGKLEQMGQIAPSGSFQCGVINNAGGTTAVHCTVNNIPPHTSPTIQVQGRGSAAGAGHLTATINSDPGVQFDNKTQQLNVTIT